MNKSFIIGIILGASIGAVAGLILTPRPGTDIRHNLAEGSHKARVRIGCLAHSVRERASGVEEAIKQAI